MKIFVRHKPRRMPLSKRPGVLLLGIGAGMAWLAVGCGGGGPSNGSSASTVNVTISPTSASVAAGNTEPFKATVTGTSNTAVTWSVDQTEGGNSTVGTISTSGLYTAPQTVPSPNTVTVKVTSRADASKSDVASVTITAPVTNKRTVSVLAGAESGGVNIAVRGVNPTLLFIAVGIGSTAGGAGVEVDRGTSASLFLVGKGFVPGTFYEISGSTNDVTVTQPSAAGFSQTTDGTPAVNVNISVSSSAALGPRNILVTNAAGEITAFVGGLLITQ